MSKAMGQPIVIDNRDSPPLDVTGVEAEGNVYELVFLASPDARHQLLYGAPRVEPARYDTAAIQTLLQEGFAPQRAELGPEQFAQRLKSDYDKYEKVVKISGATID